MVWTPADVHEALIRWGATAVRLQDGGLGYPSRAPWVIERVSTPYRALEPAEYASAEYAAIDAAIRELDQPLRVVLLCYYKPGHLRANVPMGIDGKGRQRSPSLRAIAGFMLISKEQVMLRLSMAKAQIAEYLTSCKT